jgi:hypothetical protein
MCSTYTCSKRINVLVLETSFTVNNNLGCLTTIEVARDLSVGLLTLVTTS